MRLELAFIEDNVGKAMVFAGVLLLACAVLWFSRLLGSMLSAVSLFSGILLVFFGLGIQLGFFSVDFRNLGGAGTILISISVVCIALSIAAAQFSEITKVLAIPDAFRGAILGWSYVPATRPLYAWFSGVMLYASLTAFVSGIALRLFHSRF